MLVGLGRSPRIQIANGPKGKATQCRTIRSPGFLASTPSGRRMFIIRRNAPGLGKPIKFLGHVVITDYLPPRDLERAGSFKAGKHWVHEHHERGGKWPRIYQDKQGNFIYGPSTYRVGKWIEH